LKPIVIKIAKKTAIIIFTVIVNSIPPKKMTYTIKKGK